ncbi:MAG: tetratricopeptide repeat protein, partial [Bacteroidales bacterium]|nr:tetratricopeptide repeat protein [Bacteroidales bacterium]
EIKNQTPDLKTEIPQLKDTVKYIQDLKGDFTDWQAFVEIAKIYRRYGNEQNAYPYFVNAYNLIASEIKKDSLNPRYYSDMAQLYLDAGNQEYAQAYLNMTYQMNPEDTLVLKLLPMYLATSGDIQKAEKINNIFLQKSPNDLTPYVNTLTIEIFKVLYDSTKLNNIKAINARQILDLSKIKTASEKYKKDKAFNILYNVGQLFALYVKYSSVVDMRTDKIILSEPDRAELKRLQKFFTKAVSSSAYKNKHILYKSLGFIYLLQNDLNAALKYFKEMMKFWPKDELSNDYDIVFAVQFFLKKDTTKAINTLKEKIELNKNLVLNNAEDYIRLGNTYLQTGKYKEAKNAYNKALSVNSEAINAYLGLSVLEMLNKNFQESNKYMNLAYDIDKNYYLTYALFGVLTLMADDYEQAKSSLEQALKLKPDDETIEELYQKFFEN